MNPSSSSVTGAHYADLLAPLYAWMIGDLDRALEASRAELLALGVGRPRADSRALDLGAGLGLQSIPLAELGYRVTAIDTSEALLAELRAARPDVRTEHADMLELERVADGPAEVVVCMGDTLPHLPSEDDVRRCLASVARALAMDGIVVFTFRDYVSSPRVGPDRFIQVRADDRRILTCCLDFGEQRVEVTDVVHERRGDRWEMRASSYAKLRLDRGLVTSELERNGLVVERAETARGRVAIVARRK